MSMSDFINENRLTPPLQLPIYPCQFPDRGFGRRRLGWESGIAVHPALTDEYGGASRVSYVLPLENCHKYQI
jgi:hypothetical protein